jgi:tRNA (guanine37-N1)-methyltransferase
MKFNIVTLFPQLIEPHLKYLPFKKALENNLLQINLVNLRNFAMDSYGTVDDKPYGGGVGMLLKIEPLDKALQSIKSYPKNTRTILLSPKGKKYQQKMARKIAKMPDVTLICGRYEGVDARIEKLVDESISIGDFILSGGELGALAIMESAVRLLPGVLEKEEAVKNESFSTNNLEYPQYTRPEEYKGMRVPKVLLSGDHKKIEEWRKKEAEKLFKKREK